MIILPKLSKASMTSLIAFSISINNFLNLIVMKTCYVTWEEAQPDLEMLRFNLGMSDHVIKEAFDNDYYLQFIPQTNNYIWRKKP